MYTDLPTEYPAERSARIRAPLSGKLPATHLADFFRIALTTCFTTRADPQCNTDLATRYPAELSAANPHPRCMNGCRQPTWATSPESLYDSYHDPSRRGHHAKQAS